MLKMSKQPPQLSRKSSAPWDRLRPVKQDPLESLGFVSKGDTRLLDPRTQESYYHKIVARYMQFCTQHSKHLEQAFASLSLDTQRTEPSKQGNKVHNRSTNTDDHGPLTAIRNQSTADSVRESNMHTEIQGQPSDELSTILSALRKLREGLLATSNQAPSPVFSQRVHVFNIRLAILALHPESYQASLRYLLFRLHTVAFPLPLSDLKEMTTYLIMDTALREGDLVEAYALRARARAGFNYRCRDIDDILVAVVSNNWIRFWRVYRRVDGYIRALLHFHIETLRKSVLKAIGKSYMKCDIKWIVGSATGNELSWDELVACEDVGWLRDGETAIIRKPKPKT